ALCAPKRLVIANSVAGSGEKLSDKQLRANYRWTSAAFKARQARPRLHLSTEMDAAEVAKTLVG
ncbi:MAG: hypothetical protein QF805_16280, partial [Pirellulaceae bacterium]|nr:hypothetical protein [Pirellulaceae bacterium]